MTQPRTYMKLTAKPATDPITLGDVKLFLKIDGSDEDVLLAELITCATEAAEKELRRSLITQTWKLSLDLPVSNADSILGEGVYDLPVSYLNGSLPSAISLPYGPLQSITSVVTYDTANNATTMSSSYYRADAMSDRLVLNETAQWPSGLRDKNACEITYVVGFGAATDIPSPIKFGIREHIARMYEGRTICDLPESSAQLYRKYRKYG